MESYACLEKFVNEFNLLCSERGGFAQIQKVHSSPYYIYLSVRFAGLSQFIVVGRAFPFSYLGLHAEKVEAELRVKDRLVDWYRKVFRNKKLRGLSFDRETGCLKGSFQNEGEILFCFFQKEPLWLYSFEEKGKKRVIDSISMKTLDLDQDITALDDLVPKEGNMQFKVREYSLDLQRESVVATIKKDLKKSVKKEERFKKQKHLNITADITKLEKVIALKSQLIEHSLDLDQALKELNLLKKFKTEKSIEQKRDKLFKLIKRYEIGLKILKGRLEELEKPEEDQSFEGRNSKESIEALFPRSLDIFQREEKKIVAGALASEVRFYRVGNIKFAVGKSPRGNDYLRNKFGSKSDYWFHLEGEKGAHLVAKSQDISFLLQECVDVFGSILRDASNLNITTIPLIFCQLSDLKSVKGRPGAVVPKRPRYFVANYLNNWKEIITDIGEKG